jgi:predicted NBD/HSP70 family sugar kinase
MLHIDLEADSEKDATRRAGRQATLAYVKLSTEVNAAVAFEGDLLGGKNHPYVHIVRPPRYQTYDGEFDKFRGVCQYHLDCYAGLVSGRAIQKRLDELYRLPAEHLARLDECDRRPGLPATQYSRNHPIWELVCYYMAHLCTVVLATHVPSLIVIGGRYIHDRLDPDETERALPQRIGAELVRQLSLDKPSVEVPHYPDLQRTDDFIQRALCELPGVYGALVLGARKIGLSGRERAN